MLEGEAGVTVTQSSPAASLSLRMNQAETMTLLFIPWNMIELKASSLSKSQSLTTCYPPWNYISIRHDPNYNWAQRQLEQG